MLMPRPDNPNLRFYKDLFFGLDFDMLPDFDFLNRIKLPSQLSKDELPPDLRDHVKQHLESICMVCRESKFTPLILEFALITDTRVVGPSEEDSYFSSYIAVFADPAPALSVAYQKALKFMGSAEAGGEQIVPHNGLFSPEVAFICFNCADVRHASSASLSNEIKEAPLYLTGVRQNFVLIEEPKNEIVDQVKKFIHKLLITLEADDELHSIASGFAQSSFLLLPFVRPGFESAALPSSDKVERERFRGYPGGALFLFLKPEEPNASLDQLGRRLSWLLAEASLRESYASFHLEESRKRNFVSYILTHPLKHRLGALYSDTERLIESYSQSGDDFELRLEAHQTLVDAVYYFAELVHTLHNAAVRGAQETLTAQESDGTLKYSTIGTLDLRSIVKEAENNKRLSRKRNRRLEITYTGEFNPVVDGFLRAKAINNSVRLKDLLYQEIVYELIRNVIEHFSPDEEVSRCEMGLEMIDGKPAVVITNDVDEVSAQERLGNPVDNWKEWRSASPTGLTFIADTLRLTSAGSLYYKHSQKTEGARVFSVALALKGLRNARIDGEGSEQSEGN